MKRIRTVEKRVKFDPAIITDSLNRSAFHLNTDASLFHERLFPGFGLPVEGIGCSGIAGDGSDFNAVEQGLKSAAVRDGDPVGCRRVVITGSAFCAADRPVRLFPGLLFL